MPRPIGISFPEERSGWDKDPIVAAEDIGIAEQRLRRLYIPLDQARYVIAQNIESHFETQTDPDHLPWQEWSETYAVRQTNIGEILQRTYALQDAATDPGNYEVISGSMSGGAYGSGEVALVGSNLPDYWIWHQEGIPGKLPKRSFLGLDVEGEDAVEAVFDAWVDSALVGTLVRGKLGQIGQPMGRGGRFRTFFR